jgi:hypothetical protein
VVTAADVEAPVSRSLGIPITLVSILGLLLADSLAISSALLLEPPSSESNTGSGNGGNDVLPTSEGGLDIRSIGPVLVPIAGSGLSILV